MSESLDKLKQKQDERFDKWLNRKFATACRNEKRWKTHLDTNNGRHMFYEALRLKRCVREAAAYEEMQRTFDAKLDAVKHLLAAAMGRNEISPATYQEVIEIVRKMNVRRNNTDECDIDPQHTGS